MSPAFRDRESLPLRFTGEGEDISPPLQWSGAPPETREFALICEDPDAPKTKSGPEHFIHWVVYHLSPSTGKLPLGLAQRDELQIPVIANQGINSFGKVGWNGPFPPQGHGLHHYHFRLYALNSELQLKPGADALEFLDAIQGHILETTELIGTYERSGRLRGPRTRIRERPESRP